MQGLADGGEGNPHSLLGSVLLQLDHGWDAHGSHAGHCSCRE